jgi:Ca-activated chloride channel family protein
MGRDLSSTRIAALAAGVLLLLAVPLQAGPLFVAGHMDGDKFVPAEGVAAPWYGIRYSTTAVTVEDGKARFQTEETIDSPEKGVQAVALIPLPEGADGSDLRVTLGAPDAKPTVLADATYLAPKKAQALYEAVAQATKTGKLLGFSGRPAVVVPRVELHGKQQMTVSFGTTVRHTDDANWLTCPMPALCWARSSVERLAINVTLRTREPLRSIFSPTHNADIHRKDLHEATASVRADHWSGLDDFRLYWVADKDDLGLRVLAYRPEGKEDGFFMLLGNPTGAATEQVIDKDVVFVLDTSGSMRGEKIEQARSALDYCLDHLNRGDRFNIITFGTDVTTFRDDLVALTPANLTAGREFVENVVANGRTNISGALAKALAGKAEAGRPRIMMFLTDGAPTSGELVPDKIIEQVQKADSNGTKIFVMGVGNDVNAHLLDRLAEVTDGSSEYVAPREELDAKIAALYDRLSHPVLSGVKVSFGGLTTQSVLPPKLPVLFKGSEIMMVGRYKDGGKHTFTISGSLSGKETKYTCDVDLPKKAGATTNEFLAPLWAARQIGYLLQEIRLRGPNKELIEEVVRLSRQYGIVTEYTDFIASMPEMPAGAGGPAPAAAKAAQLRLAEDRITQARGEKAGQWAVNQAYNDKDLQKRAVAGNAVNAYRDRRGNLTTVNNVTLVGRRAFYLQNGQWVDAEEAGDRKTRVVKLFSPEYFELIRNDADFARAQHLGWALSINVGEERIVIEKDGKQKDESLAAPAGIPNDPGLNQVPNVPRPQLPPQNKDIRQQNLIPDQLPKRRE